MKLTFTKARLDAGAPAPPFTFWLGPVGTIDVDIGGQLFYREEEFPLVELAISLEDWLQSGRGDFTFVSIESDDQPIFWARDEHDGWHLGAVDQLFDDLVPHDRSELELAFVGYVEAADAWARAELGVSLADVRASLRGH